MPRCIHYCMSNYRTCRNHLLLYMEMVVMCIGCRMKKLHPQIGYMNRWPQYTEWEILLWHTHKICRYRLKSFYHVHQKKQTNSSRITREPFEKHVPAWYMSPPAERDVRGIHPSFCTRGWKEKIQSPRLVRFFRRRQVDVHRTSPWIKWSRTWWSKYRNAYPKTPLGILSFVACIRRRLSERTGATSHIILHHN